MTRLFTISLTFVVSGLLFCVLVQAEGLSFTDITKSTGTGEVFVPQLVMYTGSEKYYKNPKRIDADIKTFLVEHGFNGFHTNVFCRYLRCTICNRYCKCGFSEAYSVDPSPGGTFSGR